MITVRPALRAGALILAGTVLAGTGGLAAPAAASRASTPVPVLTSISAVHKHRYDQLVFQFAGALPAYRSVRYVTQLADGAVTVAGRARLLVSFRKPPGRNLTVRGPARLSYALPGVIQVVAVPGQQRVIEFGVGLARRERFRVYASSRSDQVLVDVQTPYPTVPVREYFVNARAVFGTALTRRAERPLIEPATPAAALQRLFAGPTQGELASGLRFVSSGATGVTVLTISQGVARIRLTGGCSSGGSTVTVATEIEPTLRQFPSVRWVKIYDRAGRTEQPTGLTDSIPSCLAPSAAGQLAAGLRGPVLILLLIPVGLGLLLGLVLSLISMVVGLVRRPDLIGPRAYRAERIKARPVETGQFEPDSAWPLYPLRQVRADLARIESDRQARYGKLWHWPFGPLVWILFLPISVAAVICLLVAGLTTLALAALFAIVTWACAAAVTALFAGGLVLLRGVEYLWHTRMHTEASCPRCYHVTPRPAYRCPGCSELHRDIRPGRLGLLHRRCECGHLLPTMVLRAAWRLEAVCQRCQEPLRVGAAALRDVRIPIFGDTSAGKTRFLYAGLDSLIDTTSRARIPLGFPEEESESQATVALDLIRSGQDTVKTSRILPIALSCRIGSGASSTLVHLFDAAGEHYRGAEGHDSLGFLDHGHGLVYVLDPFSIGAVRDRVAGQNALTTRLANAAAGDPETAYGEVVSRLRDSGVKAAAQRLAIVVSKTDLLTEGGLELPAESEAIAEWLTGMGVHNVVLSARRDFAEVRYFAVASLAAAQTNRSHDPGAPLRWLLASRGVHLPVGPDETRFAGTADHHGPDLNDGPGHNNGPVHPDRAARA